MPDSEAHGSSSSGSESTPLSSETGSGSPAPGRVIPFRSVAGWVLYDLANTVFSMGVISLTFPSWIREQVGADRVDHTYGMISAVSMGVIFLFSPLLGAMTDRAKKRMPFLIVSTIISVALTACMARFGFWGTALAFICANIAYQAGTQYYDSLLPEVSDEHNRGKIGGIGVGIGYLGSFVAVGLSFALHDAPPKTLFTAYAIAFLIFSLPCMLFVHERINPHHGPFNLKIAIQSLRQTLRTLRESQQYPGLLRFLIARMFYTDAINTVINVMTLFVLNVAATSGVSAHDAEKHKGYVMLSAIAFAIAGGFSWGWLNDRIGPKKTLRTVLGCWIAIFILAAAIGILGLPLWVLYGMSAMAGFCLGGVWAADRPFMLRLTPPSRIGEFYGLYGMVGRFSAITGPVVWGAVTATVIQLQSHGKEAGSALVQAQWARVAQGSAALALLLMVCVGFVCLGPVSDKARKWEGRDAVSPHEPSPNV